MSQGTASPAEGRNRRSSIFAATAPTWLTARQDEMVASVREIVLRESPTHDKKACDELCAHLAREFTSGRRH